MMYAHAHAAVVLHRILAKTSASFSVVFFVSAHQIRWQSQNHD